MAWAWSTVNDPVDSACPWFTMPAPALAASCAIAVAFSAWFSLAPPSITIPAMAISATNSTSSISVIDPVSLALRQRGNVIRRSLPFRSRS